MSKKWIYKDNELSLWPFTEKDINDIGYREWFTDQEVTKYNSHGLFPLTETSLKEFISGLNSSHLVMKIVTKYSHPDIKDQYTWIGNCSLQSFNWINRSAEFAIVIGEKDSWGNNYATRALRMLLFHGFNKMNLNRIWTGTTETNIGMQMVARKLNMTLEGRSREGVFLNGKYVDVFHYGILKREWENNSIIHIE